MNQNTLLTTEESMAYSIQHTGAKCYLYSYYSYVLWGSPGGSDSKESACNAGDLGSIPGLGRSPGGGHIPLLLPGESPSIDEPGGLESMGPQIY